MDGVSGWSNRADLIRGDHELVLLSRKFFIWRTQESATGIRRHVRNNLRFGGLGGPVLRHFSRKGRQRTYFLCLIVSAETSANQTEMRHTLR